MPNARLSFSKNPAFNRAALLLFSLTLLFSGSADAVERQTAVVHEVLTGDTVRLEGGRILRYANLQAPPMQSAILLVRKYGENSMLFNQSLVAGKRIQVEWGNQVRDDQGNLLGFVHLEDGTFVNREILKSGHARAAIAAPNLKYEGLFRRDELAARRAKKGMWEKEPENPYLKSEFIGDLTTKKFHFPTCRLLERIPRAHTTTFNSRVSAVAAGYTSCPECRGTEETVY
jgi:micrococcal nuclease